MTFLFYLFISPVPQGCLFLPLYPNDIFSYPCTSGIPITCKFESKDCDYSSIFTIVSNVSVVFGIDKGSVWIILLMVALLPPVVICGVLYAEHCGKKMLCLVMGGANLLTILVGATNPLAHIKCLTILRSKWKNW